MAKNIINHIITDNGEAQINYNALANLPTPLPFERGEGLDSIQFNNGEAIGDGSLALGKSSMTGCRGYFIKSIDVTNKKIYLGNDRVIPTVSISGFLHKIYWYVAPDMIASMFLINTDSTSLAGSYTETTSAFKGAVIRWLGDAIVDTYDPTTGEFSFTNRIDTYKYVGNTFYDTVTKLTVIDDTDTSFITPGYQINNRFMWGYYDGNSAYLKLATIAAIHNNVITYKDEDSDWTTLAQCSFLPTTDSSIYTFMVPVQPKIGITAVTGNSFAIGNGTRAVGNYSFAAGHSAQALDYYTVAIGTDTLSSGFASFAQGIHTKATYTGAHAQGADTVASGYVSHAEGAGTVASHAAAHAEGSSTVASGAGAHAEGDQTVASGNRSHAEGYLTVASGIVTHAEGDQTIASGNRSHAEGFETRAEGAYSHTEGGKTIATGIGAHAEGQTTQALEYGSHAEGIETQATGEASHAEGRNTVASGIRSHAEGNATTASGTYSHAEGDSTQAVGDWAHAEGEITQATGNRSHAEGYNTKAQGAQSHTEGNMTTATGTGAHAEGGSTLADNEFTHAEGRETQATGYASHAEGSSSKAGGTTAHAEGSGTEASGYASHTEGSKAKATNTASHAEGADTEATGYISHAEGSGTKSTNTASHSEGLTTTASGYAAHAEGIGTVASGKASHASGLYTVAKKEGQTVVGTYNDEYADDYENALFVVGGGRGVMTAVDGYGQTITHTNVRNVFTVSNEGDLCYKGNLTVVEEDFSINPDAPDFGEHWPTAEYTIKPKQIGYLSTVTSDVQAQLDALTTKLNALQTENWTFTLESGDAVTKAVYVK